eukprot:Em0018g1175a
MTFYDKEKLYAHTSIAEWILPAIYAGHVDWVVWVKPPWAQQMDEGTHNLTVGKDVTSGHVRVSTPLPYYISELLYVPLTSLQNTRTVPLHVVTIGGCACCDGAQSLPVFLKGGVIGVANNHGDESPSPPSKRLKISTAPDSDGGAPLVAMTTPQVPLAHSIRSPLTDLTHPINPVCSLKCTDITVSKCAVTILKSALKACTAWWLDIDLDFFSTANPFKSVFTREQFEYMEALYALKRPDDPSSPQSIAESVRNRQTQLSSLRQLLSNIPTTHSNEVFSSIYSLIGTIDSNGSVIDAESLHLAGMMTDLPHHISNADDLTNMAASMYHLLDTIWQSDPSIITIARSTQDEYTPAGQVDDVQLLVIRLLEEMCAHTDLRYHYHYLSTPEYKRQQSPLPLGDTSAPESDGSS